MFDIGYGELIVIAIVALLVVGPERLPSALRTAGLWIARLRRGFEKVRAEIEQEVGADDIRRQIHNDAMLDQAREIRREIEATARSLQGSLDPAAATAPRSRTEAMAAAGAQVANADELGDGHTLQATDDVASPALSTSTASPEPPRSA